jgi:hypothetical protein
MILVSFFGLVLSVILWLVGNRQMNYYLRTTAHVVSGMACVVELVTVAAGIHYDYVIFPPF